MKTALLFVGLGLCTALVAAAAAWGAAASPLQSATYAALSAVVSGGVLLWLVRWRFERLEQRLSDLRQAMASEHAERDQKEHLLRTIVESAPMAIVVYGEFGRIAYSNTEARGVFFEGQPLEGHNFLKLLERAPEPMRHGLLSEADTLFTVEHEGETGTYHLAKRSFEVGPERQTLLMVKPLTEELGRQEIEVWKRVIRIINHELNNSLAPISSMVHSARLIAKNPEQLGKLSRVFDTIEERAGHLVSFLEGYARFARLPKPRQVEVAWDGFLDGLRGLFPSVNVSDPPPGPGWFDTGQMQQALINLLKNAEESGGAPGSVELAVDTQDDGGVRFEVRDRGKGMTDDVFKNALVPFFSTKEKGTGLGLALCREIVDAHGGKLRLSRREGGGMVVGCSLPGRTTQLPSRTVRLTLTRG